MRRFVYRPRRRQGPLCERRPLTPIRRRRSYIGCTARREWRFAAAVAASARPVRGQHWRCRRRRTSAGRSTSSRTALSTAGASGSWSWSTTSLASAWRGRRHLDLRRTRRARARHLVAHHSRRRRSSATMVRTHLAWRSWRGPTAPASTGTTSCPASRSRTPSSRASSAGCGTSCLNEEIFQNLPHARHVLERWRLDYNHVRPHSAHAGLPPAQVRRRAAGARLGLVDGPAARPLAPSPRPCYHPSGLRS